MGPRRRNPLPHREQHEVLGFSPRSHREHGGNTEKSENPGSLFVSPCSVRDLRASVAKKCDDLAGCKLNSIVPMLLVLTVAVQSDSVRVEPSFGVAGNFGTWTVTYQVGRDGILPGGGLRVQLPDTWHAGERNSANRLQATDPTADHYISATAHERVFASRPKSNRNRATIS